MRTSTTLLHARPCGHHRRWPMNSPEAFTFRLVALRRSFDSIHGSQPSCFLAYQCRARLTHILDTLESVARTLLSIEPPAQYSCDRAAVQLIIRESQTINTMRRAFCPSWSCQPRCLPLLPSTSLGHRIRHDVAGSKDFLLSRAGGVCNVHRRLRLRHRKRPLPRHQNSRKLVVRH